jgi:hexokinase
MNIQTLSSIKNNFVKELQAAQKGKKTSLPFIVHQLADTPVAKKGETFQVLKIGGSILQKAMVYKPNGDILTKTFEEEHLPVFTTKDIFLSVIDKNLNPRTETVAINFAYPMKPIFENGKLDGILIAGTKEHAFNGLVGQPIGKTIELYIKTKYNRDIKVSVANDTICLALAGLTKHTANELSGGIVGTGMNFAVFLDDTHLVNLEAANFNKFPQSDEGKQIDAQSITPGGALFEKEVSGGYLYHHFNILLTKNQIKHPSLESTHQMDRIARGNIYKATETARTLFEHSASLIACQVAGITEYKKHDMTFVMEGSLFWIGWHYKQLVEKYVKLLVPKYTVTFEEIKDCGIIGAAKLVT